MVKPNPTVFWGSSGTSSGGMPCPICLFLGSMEVLVVQWVSVPMGGSLEDTRCPLREAGAQTQWLRLERTQDYISSGQKEGGPSAAHTLQRLDCFTATMETAVDHHSVALARVARPWQFPAFLVLLHLDLQSERGWMLPASHHPWVTLGL